MPHRLVADDNPGLAVPVAPADPVYAGHAHRSAVDLDHPLHAVGVLAHALEPLLLLSIGERADARRVAEDVGIVPPPLIGRELFLPRRSQDALFAAENRT